MIAVLYKNGKLGSFIDQVKVIDGDIIEAIGGGAKGVTHDVLIIDEGSIRYDRIEAARIPYTEYEADEQGIIPQPVQKENIIYTDVPILVTSKGEYRSGDDFDHTLFTDQRGKLPKTQAQIDKERLDDLELMMADLIMGGI